MRDVLRLPKDIPIAAQTHTSLKAIFRAGANAIFRSTPVLVIVLLALVTAPSAAQEGPPPTGFRPDAPPYGLHGPHWVGMVEDVIEPDGDRLLGDVAGGDYEPESSEFAVIAVRRRSAPAGA